MSLQAATKGNRRDVFQEQQKPTCPIDSKSVTEASSSIYICCSIFLCISLKHTTSKQNMYCPNSRSVRLLVDL